MTHDPTTCALCQIDDDDTDDTGLPAALVAIVLCLLTIAAVWFGLQWIARVAGGQ